MSEITNTAEKGPSVSSLLENITEKAMTAEDTDRQRATIAAISVLQLEDMKGNASTVVESLPEETKVNLLDLLSKSDWYWLLDRSLGIHEDSTYDDLIKRAINVLYPPADTFEFAINTRDMLEQLVGSNLDS